MRTSTDLTEALDAIHASHHISHGRFIVLMLLNHDPAKPVNPADLADRADVTRATMTGLVDRLERDGWVRREPSPDDRRMLLVRLTATGRRYYEKILPDYLRRVAGVMRHLTEAERRTLVGLMGKIAQAVPEISAAGPRRCAGC
jgi:DNA-binding MarR family transcriptional regulator